MNKQIRRIQIISIFIVILSLIGINFTYSLYADHTKELNNTFMKIKDTSIVVNETFDGDIKRDVYFTINSDVPSYIKVKLIFNYLDEEGNVLAIKPKENIDYSLSLNTAWLYKDGYYYLNDALTNKDLPILIYELKPLKHDHKLSLDILVQVTNKSDV